VPLACDFCGAEADAEVGGFIQQDAVELVVGVDGERDLSAVLFDVTGVVEEEFYGGVLVEDDLHRQGNGWWPFAWPFGCHFASSCTG